MGTPWLFSLVICVISLTVYAIAWLLQDLMTRDLFWAISILCLCLASIIVPMTYLALMELRE